MRSKGAQSPGEYGSFWDMAAIDPFCPDLSQMVLRLAGEAGQVSLAMTATSARARATVDQHAAEIRDALSRVGRPVTAAVLLSYAQGFTEAAIARGWWPPHRQENLRRDTVESAGLAELDHAGAPTWEAPLGYDAPLDHDTRARDALDLDDPLALDPLGLDEPQLDWESLRLAAICRMLIEAKGLGL
jgi:hypothetical protein